MKNLLIILISIIAMSCSTTINDNDNVVDPQNQAPAGADYSYNIDEGAIIDVKDNPYSVEYTLIFILENEQEIVYEGEFPQNNEQFRSYEIPKNTVKYEFHSNSTSFNAAYYAQTWESPYSHDATDGKYYYAPSGIKIIYRNLIGTY